MSSMKQPSVDLQDPKTDFQEQGPRKGIVIIVITILLGTNGLLLWQFFDKKSHLDIANQQIMTTTAEKDALQTQLNQFKAEFEKLKTENASLNDQLSEKDEQIKAKVAEIQKLILVGGPTQIAKAKAELARLKEMNDIYIVQIDSLKAVAANLQQQNEGLSSDLNKEKSKSENLSRENDRLSSKVNAGSILKAINIVTEAVRFRSNGKEVLTNKAKQVNTIRTKFILAENRVVDAGPIDIFIRATGPDGSVVTAGMNNNTMRYNNQDISYTSKETVNYNNTDMPVTVAWVKGSQFVKGLYNVEIYQAGTLIGKSSIDLK